MKSSKLFQETRRRSIDQGRRLSISGRVSLESARICYISLRVDRGLLSALGRYCSMGGSRRSDRAEQVSAVSRGIGTRRNRVNPVRCRETRHVGGRPGAEVDEVKSVEVEMDGDTEVWYGYCTVAERGSGRGRALAGKLLRHGPSRGAGAEAGPKAGGGDFLGQGSGLCGLCWLRCRGPDSRHPSRTEARAWSSQWPVPVTLQGGGFWASNKECEGSGMLEGRGPERAENGQGLFHFSNHFTSRHLSQPFRLKFIFCRRYGVSTAKRHFPLDVTEGSATRPCHATTLPHIKHQRQTQLGRFGITPAADQVSSAECPSQTAHLGPFRTWFLGETSHPDTPRAAPEQQPWQDGRIWKS